MGSIAAAVLVVVGVLAVYAFQQSHQARLTTARLQTEQGVQMLEAGNEQGLLYLLDAVDNAPAGSELHASAQRLWAGWYEPYANRVDLVIDVDEPAAVGFIADGSILGVSSKRGGLHLFDATKGRPLADALVPGSSLNTHQFGPGGSLLAAGAADGTLFVWDARTRSLLAHIDHPMEVLALSFSGDGSRLAVSSLDGTVEVRDVGTWNLVGPVREHASGPHGVSLDATGTMVGVSGCPARQ